ncbi:unnamed protein product [Bursaphelenchus xylophilus]|uniref:(pine wood nematode) hypothetical protein n=1 Tax=Bursaphelenchus xylophilus TaxID=6326 RepID=A0A811JYD8_BURXY|nr:unnamed protein product [Bursaphelenchus xylophilus]CAG9080804.1 unnamed protein product [Bursaphelenchus xylophilus]
MGIIIFPFLFLLDIVGAYINTYIRRKEFDDTEKPMPKYAVPRLLHYCDKRYFDAQCKVNFRFRRVHAADFRPATFRKD